jgi:hypothetical protein
MIAPVPALLVALLAGHLAPPRDDLDEPIARAAEIVEAEVVVATAGEPPRTQVRVRRAFGCGEGTAAPLELDLVGDEHAERWEVGENGVFFLGPPLADGARRDLLVKGEKVAPEPALADFLVAACKARREKRDVDLDALAAVAAARVPRVSRAAGKRLIVMSAQGRGGEASIRLAMNPTAPPDLRAALAGPLGPRLSPDLSAEVARSAAGIPLVRSAWLAAVGDGFGSFREAIPALREALASGTEAEQVAAARSLARLGDDGGRARLEAALASPRDDLRAWAKDGLTALKQHRWRRLAPWLLFALVAGGTLLALRLSYPRKSR